MAHKTKINGTTYDINGGSCKINGTKYDIKSGRTKINGTGYDINFKKPLSNYSEGEIIYLNENNILVPFYVAKHNYESNLNGTGKTLVVRQSYYDKVVWNNISGNNNYANSSIDNWLNSTYKNLLDTNIRSFVEPIIIYYSPDGSRIQTLSRSVFLLSLTEFGMHNAEFGSITIGSALPIANTLQETVDLYEWTRTPDNGYLKNNAYCVRFNKSSAIYQITSLQQIRPAFTLPSSVMI